VERVFRWLGIFWAWWNQHWFRFQAVATPVGSLLTTLLLSESECAGWCLTSQAEVELASGFASAGILIYTASFAALETGVMLVVLAWKVKEFFDSKAIERFDEAVAMGIEAQRRSQTTGQPVEEVLREMKAAGWKPVKP
jgi:hypothetical protein